jgi:exopolysaccharide biosynthesis polyprenyl glycosylphosphotransferase
MLYGSLYFVFFYLFSIENWQVWNLSRTMVMTHAVFIGVGLMMTAVYGGYDIGRRKSKPIVYSLCLAVFFTDIATYLTLCIMNTNPANNNAFTFTVPEMLLLVFMIHVILIILFTYGGNALYFSIYQPERAVLITSCKDNAAAMFRAVGKYKKQYNIVYVDDYRDTAVYDHIMHANTVFMHDVPVREREALVEFCYKNFKNVYYSPDISDIVQINAKHIILDDVSLIAAPVKELTLEQRLVKRLMDVMISLVAIVISSPIWLVCAILIHSYDKGPVFFVQNRVTKNGKIFSLYKFRTMRVNHDNHSVTSDDDRITPVGKVLRKYRIDELPQFLNILKGEMSVVGPRPEMMINVYNYTNDLPEFEYRLRVKAGLTGYAQIAGKYSTSPKDKLILDMMYIENYSFWSDVKLILQTLIVFFKQDSTEAFKKQKDINWDKYK